MKYQNGTIEILKLVITTQKLPIFEVLIIESNALWLIRNYVYDYQHAQ